jgi:hypothetical protein
MGSGRRFMAGGGAMFNNNQLHQTLPNGTPSWMHIYQSTSTPLEDDLSARLEKVNASSGLHMNFKSRFTDRIHGEDNGNNPQNNNHPSEKNENEENNGTEKPKSAGTRTPTWARGRGGKVTLGSSAGTGSAGGRNANTLRR